MIKAPGGIYLRAGVMSEVFILKESRNVQITTKGRHNAILLDKKKLQVL